MLISWVNTYLLYAMLVLLGVVMGMAAPHVQVHFLQRTTGLSFSTCSVWCCLPSLGIPYCRRSPRGSKTRSGSPPSCGSALPSRVCCLLLWSLVVLGAVPVTAETGHSLSHSRVAGHPAAIPLGFVVGGSVILLGNVFAALSMLTSYIGLGVSLEDSYRDAAWRRRAVPNWVLTTAVALPPLVVALLNPDAFVRTLDIAGTFGGGLFVGVLPVLMVLRLRRSGAQAFTTWGGSALAWIVMAVYVAGMLSTAATRLSVLSRPPP